MTAFTGFCIGVMVCITPSILGEREYGRMMYRRGYIQALKDIRREQERKKVEMSEHPPDKKAAENMKRKPYQNMDVLGYLQKKYAIPEEKKNE